MVSACFTMTNRVPNVDDMFYHFSNEEGEDAILDRAFDWWELALPMVHSFNSICNLLLDDAAGAMSWSGCNSMLSCTN